MMNNKYSVYGDICDVEKCGRGLEEKRTFHTIIRFENKEHIPDVPIIKRLVMLM